MNKTILYGLFNSKGNISDSLNNKPEKSVLSHILFDNFEFYGQQNDFLLFSGEIYNKTKLMEFVGSQHIDTAQLLYLLFKKEGYMGFKRINGKFLIILNSGKDFVVARDRYGLGPMFYYTDTFFTNQFYQLFDFKNTDFKPNTDSIGIYLMYSYIPSPVTSLQNVSKLHGGHVLIKTESGFRTEDLFTYEDFISETIKIDEKEALEEYERLLKESIKKRIGTNTKVGALLSGGYDSGGNISLLPEVYDGKIESYSIGFKDNPFSELPFARMMAEKFGAEHHEYIMDGTEVDDLPFLVRNLGDPFSESGWMLNNSAMKLVHDKELPVVLGGDGSDQLFTAHLQELGLRHKLHSKSLTPVQNLFHSMAENSFFEKDNVFFKARFHNDKVLNILLPDHFGFRKYQTIQLLNKDFSQNPTFAKHPVRFKNFDELFNFKNYYVDINQNSTEIILFKASRISQLYGVNMAFTYIDEDVIQFVKSLPRNLKAKGSLDDLAAGKGVSKYLLKALIKPKLPPEVTARKKQGGFSPLQIFFSDDAKRKKIYEFMLRSNLSHDFINKHHLQNFFKAYDESTKGEYWFWYKQTMANRLINILVLCLWWEIFMTKNYHSDLSHYLN